MSWAVSLPRIIVMSMLSKEDAQNLFTQRSSYVEPGWVFNQTETKPLVRPKMISLQGMREFWTQMWMFATIRKALQALAIYDFKLTMYEYQNR